MHSFETNSDQLTEITENDAIATITGGLSPWMSTMRLAASLGVEHLVDVKTPVLQRFDMSPW